MGIELEVKELKQVKCPECKRNDELTPERIPGVGFKGSIVSLDGRLCGRCCLVFLLIEDEFLFLNTDLQTIKLNL